MDTAVLSASAALVGSLVGGVSTLAASWFTQRGQLRAQALVHEAIKREALYAEFILEAAKHLTGAWSHNAEGPEIMAGLYSAVERMRLTSSAEVIQIAQQVIQQVVEAYAAPARSFDELRNRVASLDDLDPLRGFAKACRTELSSLQV